MKTIDLTDEQFDKLEDASDILSMSNNFSDSLGEVVEMVSDFLIRSLGPLYEIKLALEEEGEDVSI